MISCRNLILQSGTNSSSLFGVISLKCFSKEIPVLEKASVPVLSRGVHADTLIPQWAWAGVQKEEPCVDAAWHPLLPSELPIPVKFGKLAHYGAIPPGSASSCLVTLVWYLDPEPSSQKSSSSLSKLCVPLKAE